mmetsp:Transcript_4418/g.12741  ORF Transcript_4418/g.12741 Transcript_4418/m.12741 type:complete len:351 (+) Transcript_4418:109-1161(+)
MDLALCGGRPGPSAAAADALHQNLHTAREVAKAFLGELREQCMQEKESFERQGRKAPREKQNRWSLYLNAARSQRRILDILKAVRRFPESRMRVLPAPYLRALVVLQHSMSEDTSDFARSELERKHCDTFEGFVTSDGVNSQLIKDAHRSEWTVDGRAFTLHSRKEEPESTSPACDRKQAIANFQRDLVTCLEEFLLEFCHRRGLHEPRARQLMQAVTTQMSQAGLANLERASQASSVYVSGQGLEQRTAYNVSTATAAGGEEVLQLSIYCMKTGFSAYHTPESIAAAHEDDEDNVGGPLFCAPTSYLYQYATLRFCPVASQMPDNNSGFVEIEVVDLIDEVHLVPVALL